MFQQNLMKVVHRPCRSLCQIIVVSYPCIFFMVMMISVEVVSECMEQQNFFTESSEILFML